MPTIYRVIYYPVKAKKSVYSVKRRLVDRVYTELLKLRKNNICDKCGHKHDPKSKGLHTSHYFSRAREHTRFDIRNTDLLCLACHLYFSHNRGEYTKFKKKILGEAEYLALFKKAKEPYIIKNIQAFDKIKL